MSRIGHKMLNFMEQSAGIGINWTSWATTFPESLASAIQSMVKRNTVGSSDMRTISMMLHCLAGPIWDSD